MEQGALAGPGGTRQGEGFGSSEVEGCPFEDLDLGGAKWKRLLDLIDDETEDFEFAEFLSTHPDPGARIDQIDALSEQYGWPARDTLAYPDAVQSALDD